MKTLIIIITAIVVGIVCPEKTKTRCSELAGIYGSDCNRNSFNRNNVAGDPFELKYEALYRQSDGWHYGDNVYIKNWTNYKYYVTVSVTSYQNVRWALSPAVVNGYEKVYIGWVSCTDADYSWSYNLSYSWEPIE